jgi:acyl-coenzyme A synthetase/AMP-(fatty) acid ligase
LHDKITIKIEKFQGKPDFNWVSDILAQQNSGKIALMILDDEERLIEVPYSMLLEKAKKYANFMKDEGLKNGDSIIIMMRMVPDLWYITVASSIVGIAYSPAPILLSENDIVYRINQTGAKAIFADAYTIKQVMEAAKGIYIKVFNISDDNFQNKIAMEESFISKFHKDPKEKHAIFFTSGTEGLPKTIVHNGYYPLGHLSTVQWLGIDSKDIHWNISSPGWAKWAWSNLYAPLVAGATAFSFDQERFSAERTLSAIENYPVTSLCTAPTVWRMFMVQDLSNFTPAALKKASSAGEPLNAEIIKRWKDLTGIAIKDGYGQTETSAVIGNTDLSKIKPGSAGKPLLHYKVKIVDDDGKELPVGKEGNIAIDIGNNVPGLFSGYGNDPVLNAERFKHGYYYTGDLGKMDSDGYVWFVSRADDVIKASDYRIGPFEVESALLTHPAVVESAVVASPDQIRGNVVKAFIILKNGYSPSSSLARELSFHVKKITAAYMRPKKIEFVKDLPKTISGKIIRKELRNLEIKRLEDKSTPTAKENEFLVP